MNGAVPPFERARGPGWHIQVVLKRCLVVSVMLTTFLTACGGSDDDSSTDRPLGGSATIDYEFGDASVPPEFHRSYTLSVTRDEVHVVVDSYGDVLHDETVPIPEVDWKRLTDIRDPVFAVTPDKSEDGCTGGTTRTLRVSDGSNTVLDLDFGVCGGVNENAAKAVEAYIQPVLDAIPDWDSIVGAR